MKYHFQNHIFLRMNQILEGKAKLSQEQFVDKAELLYVDILDKERKIVYDIQGPFHFLMNDHSKVLFTDKFRLNLYEKLGYQVKEIVAEKYDSLEGAEKQAYLVGIISEE